MTILDAANILSLVRDKWTLGSPTVTPVLVNKVINPSFELVDSSWVFQVGTNISEDVAHTGTHSFFTYEDGVGAVQTFSPAIPVSQINKVGIWAYGNTNYYQHITVVYTDDTTTELQVTFVESDTWEEFKLLQADLEVGKSVKELRLFSGTGGPVYYDDAYLMVASDTDILLQLDEYNPNHPDYQIVFANNPERIMYITPNVIRHEQDIRIEVHTKLVHYQPDDLEGIYRPEQLTMKEELTRIFNANRFDNVGNTLNHSSWRDAKFSHGLGTDAEPISFVSRMTVQIHYYEAVDGDETAIGLRPSEVKIMNEDLLGVTEVEWTDTDPWVQLQIPKGPLLEQHLLGPHIDGKIVCHDYQSLYEVLYTIPIVNGGNQFPVNVDNSKTKFSTDIPSNPMFIIYMKDVLGNLYTHEFFNVRIRKIELTRANTSGLVPISWTIHWMADYIYTTISTIQQEG